MITNLHAANIEDLEAACFRYHLPDWTRLLVLTIYEGYCQTGSEEEAKRAALAAARAWRRD